MSEVYVKIMTIVDGINTQLSVRGLKCVVLRKFVRTYKAYIFLIRINSLVDLAMSVCPYERRDLSNYKS